MSNPAKTIYVGLFDGMGKKNEKPDGSTTYTRGFTIMQDGASQANAIPVFIGDESNRASDKKLSNVINHELGHTAGLPHVWDRSSPSDARMDLNKMKQGANVTNNLMNSEENPNSGDEPSSNGDPNIEKTKIVTEGQKDKVIKTVEHEQK